MVFFKEKGIKHSWQRGPNPPPPPFYEDPTYSPPHFLNFVILENLTLPFLWKNSDAPPPFVCLHIKMKFPVFK